MLVAVRRASSWINGQLIYATAVFEGIRLAITFPLPHFRHRNRLTKWLIGASGRTPKRASSRSAIMPL
jgi:hypothetical protein